MAVGRAPRTVSWNGSQRLHVTSRGDTAQGIVLGTTVSADYDLLVGSSVGDPDGASSRNTGSFTQESKPPRADARQADSSASSSQNGLWAISHVCPSGSTNTPA